MARWQSGDAADCKSVYAGSIPTRASIFSYIIIAKHSRGVANSYSYLQASLVFQADYRLLDVGPIDPFRRVIERWPLNNMVSHRQTL